MFGYIIGSVKYLTSNHIILENNGIGYIIYVANPYSYEIGKEYTVYTYQNITENEIKFPYESRVPTINIIIRVCPIRA